MAEQFADLGEITLCYESFGDPSDPPMLLVMGLGTQMVAWHDDFVAELVERGFRVIRFDNRDCGRSTSLKGRPPTLWQMITRDKDSARYLLGDMADDAVGLLDHLDIESAHVVGASMGGMIAQTMAARHPDRVRSLTSIMSNTGSRWTGQPSFRVYSAFLAKPPKGREAYIERGIKLFKLVGGRGFGDISEEVRDSAGKQYDRGINTAGTGRQLAAILASGDRTAELRTIAAPTLVIHGDQDKLVGPSGGRATKRAIPEARGMKIEGMGHFMPRGAWPQMIDGIVDLARTADAARGQSPRVAPAA
jgi:pimeloyl-ACP methyl ester carboxylesterase